LNTFETEVGESVYIDAVIAPFTPFETSYWDSGMKRVNHHFLSTSVENQSSSCLLVIGEPQLYVDIFPHRNEHLKHQVRLDQAQKVLFVWRNHNLALTFKTPN